MSIKKYNTYFKENDGKVYYYDENGVKKEVPSTAFSNLQEQIDNLGSPLTYSGAKSVDELNELSEIKQGTVYTVTGTSGTLTAGEIDVQPSTEVAWAGEWFNIGKDLDNSWKQWSEDNGSISLSTGRNNVYIGSNNIISGSNNTVIGENNSANNPSQKNYIFGKINEVEGYDNTIVGQSNKIKNANHDLYVVGSNNILSGGYGNNLVFGKNNSAGDAALIVGNNNSSKGGGFNKATFGWSNKLSDANNFVIGINNSAVGGGGYLATVLGGNNEVSGGHVIGEWNNTNQQSYAYGYNNSSYDGALIVGKNNSGERGSYAFGDGNKVNVGGFSLGSNLSLNGSHAIGRYNSAYAGGGTFGYNNLGGKGGYIIGDNNISRKYEIINPTDPSRSSINYETAEIDNFWSQNVFGLYNYTQFKKNGGRGHGMPFQFGYNNIVQDEITWNSDYDTDTARTYHNEGIYYSTFNIGTENSAFDTGINLGYQNTILIGDEQGASINIGKNNINRMGIIIGQGNVTYDTMAYPSSTNNKSNAYSWILGQGNSANGASITVGKLSQAEQGSYTFGNGLSAYSGSMSIGLHGLYTECGGIAIGNGASAYSGSLVIGCGGLYASAGSFAFGNSVTSYRGSIGIGKNSVYVADNGYALGEFVTAGSNAVAIGLSTYATGHGYAFGNQVTGQYAGIAVGFDGVTAGGQGASFGYYGAYSDGGSITLGHNGITSHATAVALGSNGLYSDFRSIAIGQFGVTATSAGLTIGNENVYSTDRAIAIGKYDVGARGWGSFAIGIKGITADNTSWAIGYGGYGGSNYLSAHISATNESFAIGQSGISAANNSFSIGRKHLFATDESFVLGNKNIFAHDNSFNIGITGANTTEPYSNLTGNWNYGTWYNSFAIGLGRNVAHNGSFILGIHNNYGITNMNLPYSADYNSIMLAVGNGLSSRTYQDSVSIASYGLYDGLTGKSTVEYQSLLLDHQVLGEVEVKNKSIMIGGPSFCQFHFDDVYSALSANVKEGSAKADHASIVLGYNNIADGGVFAIGSNNTACDLYGTQSSWTQYTQATIFGDYNRVINYRGYIYVPNEKEGQFTQSAFTRNAIIGTNNSISGWNNFIFGTNNSAGIEEYAIHYPGDDTSAYNDDGFTLAFGLNNRAVRNYDMAIGYGSIASGGENIAIGAIKENQYGRINTKAIGYKNIAIRSNIAGISNIAIDTDIIGNIAESFDPSYYREYNLVHDNNQYYNSQLSLNQVEDNQCNISKNIINNANITANINGYFNHNIINDLTDGIFSGSLTHNDILHNNNLILNTQYTSDGIEENMFLHTTNFSAKVDEFSHNIFAHTQGIIDSVESHNNLIFNSNIKISAVNSRGFSNNFAQNSTVTGYVGGLGDSFFFDSTANYNNAGWGANNADVLFFSKHMTYAGEYNNSVIDYTVNNAAGQNFLFGTFGANLHGVFSFSDRKSLDPNSVLPEEPLLINCCRSFNFGDNTLQNAANVACLGENNFVYNIKVANINGNCNGVYTDYDGDTSDFIGIYGQSNNYIASGIVNTTINYNTIIGNNNDMVVTNSADYSENASVRNIILGNNNSYHSVKTDDFSGYNNMYTLYNEGGLSETIGTIYDNNLPTYTKKIGKPLEYVNRNIIIGQHSVISDAVNDSVCIGSRNLMYNTKYKNTIDGYIDIHWQLSNNFALGSYNLIKDGSNQVAIGMANNTSGHNSTAIGEGLISNQSQMVVGRFNEELDGTNGLSADYINSQSGALFIVGNGRHLTDDYSDSAVERSNAMIVSADGTVSARRFVEAQPDTSLQELITLLHNKPATGSKYIIGLDEQGTLTWVPVTV